MTSRGPDEENRHQNQVGRDDFRHLPVMLDRVLELLDTALTVQGAVMVDATLGLGGHAEALLFRHPDLTLIGLDRDSGALARSRERLARFADRTSFVPATYDTLVDVLAELGIDRVHGVLFDLGVSSMQLDDAARGFAYSQDGPLDMRMDPSSELSAEVVVNTYPVGQLASVLRRYGEERFAMRIATAITRARTHAPLRSTVELAELVREAIPAATRRTGGHPAKRTFQGLRIEVNDELRGLADAVPAAVDALAVGGRIVALSYHSLEDRIVKQALATRSRNSTPVDLPVQRPEDAPTLRLLTRRAERPSDTEAGANPRARSVRLRAAERIDSTREAA